MVQGQKCCFGHTSGAEASGVSGAQPAGSSATTVEFASNTASSVRSGCAETWPSSPLTQFGGFALRPASETIPACSSVPVGHQAAPIITHPKPRVTAYILAQRVAREFRLERRQISGRDRHRTAASARHMFWWLARRLWGTSYPELGRLLPDTRPFDHSSTLSGFRKIDTEVVKETLYRIGSREEGSQLGATALALLAEFERPTS